MAMLDEQRVEIEVGDTVRLEGALHTPPEPRFAAAVLHPHPHYGGDMDNHVVMAVCEAFAGRGGATLRFNFRGTGRSTGTHDGGRGEQDDALAVVAQLRKRFGGLPLVLAGYSFGAQVAAAVCERAQVAAVVLVSPPLAYGGIVVVPADVPVLALAGDHDPVCPADRLRALETDSFGVLVVPGVDHGWSAGLSNLIAAVSTFEFPLER